MALENNRLNFPSMVDHQLNFHVHESREVRNNLDYFEPQIINGKKLEIMENDFFKPPRPTDISTSINSIVATVHKNLKEKRRKITPLPPIVEEAIDNSPPESTVNTLNRIDHKTKDVTKTHDNNNHSVSSSNRNNKLSNRRNVSPAKTPQKTNQQQNTTNTSDKTKVTVADKSKLLVNLQKLYRPGSPRNKNISQIQMNTDRKQQQRLHHCLSKANIPNNNDTQKRLRTILHQKRMLEEILQDHEKIQQDRRNISTEIQIMKKYLADIRYKLDTSLKKLGTKKLIVEKNPMQKKKLIPIQSNLSTFSNSAARSKSPPASNNKTA